MRKIIRAIIDAQIASDGGKGYYELCRSPRDFEIAHYSKPAYNRQAAYAAKDTNIFLAISNICKYKPENVRFSVEIDREQKADYICYFDIKTVEGRFQVSFHSFDPRLKKFVKKSRKSTWASNTSSELNCVILRRIYNLP